MPDVEETVAGLTLTQFIEQRLPSKWVIHEHGEQTYMDSPDYPVFYIEEAGTGFTFIICNRHKAARIVDRVVEILDERVLESVRDAKLAYERKYEVEVSVRAYRNENGEIIPPHHPYLP